jgi:hypothetical protein
MPAAPKIGRSILEDESMSAKYRFKNENVKSRIRSVYIILAAAAARALARAIYIDYKGGE